MNFRDRIVDPSRCNGQFKLAHVWFQYLLFNKEYIPNTAKPILNIDISSTSLGISQAALSISNIYLFMSMNATTTTVSFTALKISLISLDISIRALEFSIFTNNMAIR
jgi:hypothetical protein